MISRKNIYGWLVLIAIVISPNGFSSQLVLSAPVNILTNITNAKETRVDSIWREHKEKFVPVLSNPYLGPSDLYDLQINTSNFVQLAVETGRADWMLDLMALYLLPYNHLQVVNEYIYYYKSSGFVQRCLKYLYRWPLSPVCISRDFKMWLWDKDGFNIGTENLIESAQFLYAITLLMVEAVKNPHVKDHPITIEFINKYLPVAFKDHYLRWILNKDIDIGVFELEGWNCNPGHFSASLRVEHLKERRFGTDYFDLSGGYSDRGYCNGVRDVDLFMIAGSVHILALQSIRPDLFSAEDQADLLNLRAYVNKGIELFNSRLSYNTVTNFQSTHVSAVNWDLGAWQGHPEFAYSGDTNPCFPGETNDGLNAKGEVVNEDFNLSYRALQCVEPREAVEASNVGNDISHARRLVRFLFTLDRYNTGLNLVDQVALDDMHKGMANQLAYEVFNRNFQAPNFTNYLDGTNGWYRVNYNGVNFGYEPFSWRQGIESFLGGGYMLWSRYNSDLIDIAKATEHIGNPQFESRCHNGDVGGCYLHLQTAASLPVELYR